MALQKMPTRMGPWATGTSPRGIQAVSMRGDRPMNTLSMCRPVNSWSPTALSHLYAGVTTSDPWTEVHARSEGRPWMESCRCFQTFT